MKDIFNDIRLEDIKVGGIRFRFPLRYFDYSLISAAFPAPVAKLQHVLPSNKLKPVQTVPNTSTVILIALEIKCVDSIKPYNEFDIMIPVTYETADDVPGLPGLYCLHIPVTTEEALIGGVEIFGYPKFLADISFEDKNDIRRCQVRAEGKDIITLEVKKSATEFHLYDTYTYTIKDRQLIRTLFNVQGQNSTSHIEGGASYTLGNHAVADQLLDLQLDETSATHRYAPQSKMLIHLPGERLPL